MGHPISREELLEKMRGALEGADDNVRAAWELIRIEPEKWQCTPWGDAGGGFWAVAVKGGEVVWYNDIEDGFNTSPFTKRGTIGEYRCNQAEFSAIVSALPEAIAAEGFAAARAAAGAPYEFAGPGRIVRRQTTFWEFRNGDSSVVRVHFSHKRETRFTHAQYDGVAIVDDHPLLEPYRERWASVFVTDAKRCDAAFSTELASRIERASAGWRTAEEYRSFGGSGVLRAGYGLLMRAPEPIAAIAADLLQGCGALPSVVLEHAPHDFRPGPVRALLLGRSFVVAEAFRFVRLK